MAQHIRTLPFLVVLPLLFAAASFGQSSDPASEEMGIPIGHKVIAMKFPSGSTLGHLHKGDLVQVISGAADSEPIARNIRVFAEPNPLKNKVGGSCIVHLLVSGKIADQILRAHKIGQIRLVLSGGTQISPTKNLKTDPNEGRGEAISTPHPDQISKVRELASKLDEIAADLESLERYTRADELREYAQNLRLDVRRKK